MMGQGLQGIEGTNMEYLSRRIIFSESSVRFQFIEGTVALYQGDYFISMTNSELRSLIKLAKERGLLHD
jgi:hypothetical protein